MSGKLVAGATILIVGSTAFCAHAAMLYGRSPPAGLGHSLGHGYGLAAPAGRFRSGTGSHAGGRYGGLNQPGSGWYPGGFGGTLTPGWGYHFGPDFGGLRR